MYFFPFSCQLHIMSPILAVLFFFVRKWLPKRIGLKCILCSFFLRSLIFSRLQSPQGHRTVDRTSLMPSGGLPCPRVFSTKFLSPNSTFLDSTLDLNVPWIWTLYHAHRFQLLFIYWWRGSSLETYGIYNTFSRNNEYLLTFLDSTVDLILR